MSGVLQVRKENCKKEEKKTLYIETEIRGKKIKRYLHSRYDPLKEARQWAESIFEEKIRLYIIYGGGWLYHIEALHDCIRERGEGSWIIMIEPFEVIAEAVRSENRYEEVAERNGVVLVGGCSPPVLRKVFHKYVGELGAESLKFSSYPPYQDLGEEKRQTIFEALNDILIRNQIQQNTLSEFSKDFPRNILKNMKHLSSSIRMRDFYELFKGESAVIVSAGPSLEKNIRELREYQDKILIIAGVRTARALLDQGIRPHFICSMDPGEPNFWIYCNLEILDQEIPLVSSWTNNYLINQYYKGEKIFYNDSYLPGLDEKIFGEQIETLTAGYTIASLQMAWAMYLGCRNIVFIGQDLAFTEGKKHAQSASIQTREENKPHQEEIFSVKGNFQAQIGTNHHLDEYRKHIEEYIDAVKGQHHFVNATEGGAYISGTEILTLKETLSLYAGKEEREYRRQIEKKLKHKMNLLSDYELLDKFDEMQERVQKIKKKALQAEIQLLKFSAKYPDQNLIRKLDRIDEEIKKLQSEVLISDYFIQAEIRELSDDDQGFSDEEIIENNKKLYRAILSAAKSMGEILTEEIGEMKTKISEESLLK